MQAQPNAAVLFDLDGTLIDTIDLIVRSYHHTAEAHGKPAQPDSFWLAGIGTPLWTQLAEIAVDEAEVDAMVVTYRKWNLAQHDALVREFDGVKEGVHALAERGAKLAVVTSKAHKSAVRGLEVCGLREYFDVIIGVDDVEEHKPHPAPVLHGLKCLDARPEESIYVGDSTYDLIAGRRAGVRTAAAIWGVASRADLAALNPDVWLEQPREFAEL